MTTFQQLIDLLEQRYPTYLAESWDQVGMHFGHRQAEVKRVMAVLDLDDTTLQEAIDKQIDTIVVHHPPLFMPIKRFDYEQRDVARYTQLIKHDIKVYAMHTNFDIAWDGMNDWLAEQLGLESIESLTPHDANDNPGIGRIGNLPQAISRTELLELLKKTYHRRELLVIEAEPKASYQRIAILGGAGAAPEYIQAAGNKQADVYLTGDISYHRAQLCREYPMMTVDVGHYMESIFIERMPELLEKLGLEIEVVRSTSVTNPFTYEM